MNWKEKSFVIWLEKIQIDFSAKRYCSNLLISKRSKDIVKIICAWVVMKSKFYKQNSTENVFSQQMNTFKDDFYLKEVKTKD